MILVFFKYAISDSFGSKILTSKLFSNKQILNHTECTLFNYVMQSRICDLIKDGGRKHCLNFMSGEVFCLYKKGRNYEVFSSNRLIGKYSKEFVDENSFGGGILCIRTERYVEPIENGIIILQKYPQLLHDNREFDKHDGYALFLVPNDDDKIYALKFKIQIQDGKYLPDFYFWFSNKSLTEQNSIWAISQLAIELGFDNTPVKITINNSENVEVELPMMELLRRGKTDNLVYHCQCGPKAMNVFNLRANIIEEIKSTERTYIHELNSIIESWIPQLTKNKCITDSDRSTFFGEIPSIRECHTAFYDSISKIDSSYGSEIIEFFIKYASRFRVSVHYVSNYPNIVDLFNIKCKSSSFLAKIKEIATIHDGHDFLSFMITPIQRMPRYQLFIRELIKCTPKSHPDFLLIQDALNAIDHTIKFIEGESMKQRQKNRLIYVQNNLCNTFQILQPSRVLLFQTDVKVKGRHLNQGVIYVFNDIVLLTKEQTKGITVLFDNPTSAFHFSPIPDDKLAISISSLCKRYFESLMSPIKEYTITFPNETKINEFFAVIQAVQDQNLVKQDYALIWKLIQLPSIPSMCNCAASANGKEFLFFGGIRTNQKYLSAQLTAVNQFTLEFTEMTAHTTGRCGHTMSILGSRLFIIGGKSRQKFFKKVLSFDLRTYSWSQPLPNSETVFVPRYGHSAVLHGTRIVIFGGKGVSKNYLNDITVFDPIDNTFEVFDKMQTKPPARSHHAAAIIGDIMYVFGGKSKEVLLSDVWAFDLLNMTWQQKTLFGSPPYPRKCHCMIPIASTLISIGGVTNKGESVHSIMIETNNMECRQVFDAGNTPNGLRKFAPLVDKNGKIFIYGGMERKSKNPLSNMYQVSLCDKWISKLSTSKIDAVPRFETKQGFFTQPRKNRISSLFSRERVAGLHLFDEGDKNFEDFVVQPQSAVLETPKKHKHSKPRKSHESSVSFVVNNDPIKEEKAEEIVTHTTYSIEIEEPKVAEIIPSSPVEEIVTPPQSPEFSSIVEEKQVEVSMTPTLPIEPNIDDPIEFESPKIEPLPPKVEEKYTESIQKIVESFVITPKAPKPDKKFEEAKKEALSKPLTDILSSLSTPKKRKCSNIGLSKIKQRPAPIVHDRKNIGSVYLVMNSSTQNKTISKRSAVTPRK